MRRPEVIDVYSREIESVYTGFRAARNTKTVWYVLFRIGKEQLKLRISKEAAAWLNHDQTKKKKRRTSGSTSP